MADWLLYWRDFKADGVWPVLRWWTNDRPLRDSLRHDDYVWFFIAGKLYGLTDEPAAHQVFLAEVMRVEKCTDNPRHSPSRSTRGRLNHKYRIHGQSDDCFAIDPPLLVEDILFPEGRDFPPARGQTAGERLQPPFVLDDDTVNALLERLQEGHPEINLGRGQP